MNDYNKARRIADIINISDSEMKQNVIICGWVKRVRKSKNICFLDINDGSCFDDLQIVLDENCGLDCNIKPGFTVCIIGDIIKNHYDKIEVKAVECDVIGECPSDYPIQNKKMSMEFLREYPHLRVKTNTINAILRMRSCIITSIHSIFCQKKFTNITTPIISGSSCEGAGNLFSVCTFSGQINNINKPIKDYVSAYFGKDVYLSVSGQLELEAMLGGLGNVYGLGPSFRADDSNTKRHASEFWMLETESAFLNLDDEINFSEEIVKMVLRAVRDNCCSELRFLGDRNGYDLFERIEKLINGGFERISYTDAVTLLQVDNGKFDEKVFWGSELRMEHIKFLLEHFDERPFYIINSPKDLKPFYVKINEDQKTVASAELYFPHIGDMVGVCEKEDNYDKLKKRIVELNMNIKEYEWYLDLRKYGSIPHSGFGMGVERMLMLISGCDNIRDAIPFPRTKCKKWIL